MLYLSILYSHQQTRISNAVLKSRFDPLLDKGQYKNNDKLKNNNTCKGTLKEPTHFSKRVGHVVPGVVVYLLFHCTFHAWVGWVSEIKYELIAAARGAFRS